MRRLKVDDILSLGLLLTTLGYLSDRFLASNLSRNGFKLPTGQREMTFTRSDASTSATKAESDGDASMD